MARKKKEVDWVRLEADWRANIKSMRILEDEYGISKTRIGQVAEENGWTRDLSAKIKARRQAKLDSALLDSKLDSERPALEGEVIEAAAQTQTEVILWHRKAIGRTRELALHLLGELESVTDNRLELADLGEMLRDPEQKTRDRKLEIYNAVIEYPTRIEAAKKLAETLRLLIGLEREAFGIEGRGAGDLNVTNNIQIAFVSAAAVHQ